VSPGSYGRGMALGLDVRRLAAVDLRGSAGPPVAQLWILVPLLVAVPAGRQVVSRPARR
jgi:hypothetical protein